jgi:serine-type D-Ala-D-Ala carboxypeptidase/endopeptidase (penicillin-binding protein 4)
VSETKRSRGIRRAVAGVLVTTAMAGAGLAASPGMGSKTNAPPANSSSFPLFSARRVPGSLRLGVGRTRLAGVVANQLDSEDLKAARPKSCVAISVGGGLVVAEGMDRQVIPASTQKTLTATSALSRLGIDTRFRTEVRATAKPVGATLTGDLWLVGGGDPLLESADYTATQPHDPTDATPLDALVDSIVKTGITTVTGSVVGDARRYDTDSRIKSWKRSYTSTGEVGVISGLMINDNFSITNTRGKRVAAIDPPADAARLLQTMLTAKGVTVVGEARSATAEDAAPQTIAPELVASIESLPLSGVIGEMLRWSDNTTAEMLVKELGRTERSSRAPIPGSWSEGIKRVKHSLTFAGVTTTGLTMIDGSGLDVSNRVTCRILLQTVQSHVGNNPFSDGLPVMGASGTLRKRLRGTAATGNVRAKTGTLNGVSSLAGTAESVNQGGTASFAMVFNGLASTAYGVRAADAIAEAMVAFPDAPPLEQFSQGLSG